MRGFALIKVKPLFKVALPGSFSLAMKGSVSLIRVARGFGTPLLCNAFSNLGFFSCHCANAFVVNQIWSFVSHFSFEYP